MKLNSKQAIELTKAYDDGSAKMKRLIAHELAVGEAAARIAKALGMDEDYARTLGYIHDIGKVKCKEEQIDGALTHGMRGYEYIKSLGYDEEYARICILHSYLNNDIDCLSGDRANRKSEDYEFQNYYVTSHKYDDYEKIINLCDLMCTDRILTVEKRMIDLLTRHGVFETTQYHIKQTMKLKKYFDDKLGYNVYDLFDEVKQNI